MSNIKVYGRLENATTNNELAGASLIFDDELNKFQSLINLEVVFKSEKGEIDGVATLNSSGKIPSELLPSYVDDVLEYDAKANFPSPGEEGKIYVAKNNNNSYRWSGSLYILIGTPLELGETSTTAYSGDKGKATTDKVNSHVSNTSNPHNVTKKQVGLGNVDNTADNAKPVSTALAGAINTAKTEAITTVGNYTINEKKINTNPTLTKTDVGLSNVNNTSDADKPISTALQLALNTKVDKVSGKSLVSDTDITKLSGLKSLTELDKDIADATTEINTKTTGHVTVSVNESAGNKVYTVSENDIASAATLTEVSNKANANETAIGVLNGSGAGSVAKAVADAKSTIDAYRVNSKVVSTNPILNGSDIKLTGYTAVTGGVVSASDTINGAINKLDTKTESNLDLINTCVKKAGDTITGLLKSTVATGTAPFTVTSTTKCTNLNADKVDNLNADALVNSDSNADWYGVSWSETSSNPDCTRIGNMDMHKTLPIQSKMRGCIINNAIDPKSYGAIRYLSNDWTKIIDDDTTFTLKENLNVFVEIPEFWWIDDYEIETETHNLKLSPNSKSGWFHHKKSYVASYEGYVVLKDHTKYYMSKKGVLPTVSINRTDLRDASRNNSINKQSTGGCEYNLYLYTEHRALCHLFLTEYATRNSQKAVDNSLTAEGYHQGGLGPGITEGAVTINGQTRYSCVPTGSSDSLGNNSGEVSVSILQSDASGNNTTVVVRKCNRYRGIENPFGHVWKHIDDIISVYDPEINQRRYYLCENPEYFATYKNEQYKFLTSGTVKEGWKKSITITPACDFFTKTVGGSLTTHWCDYNWDNTDLSQHCLLVGGSANTGGQAGLLFFYSSSGVSSAYANVGSRLVYLPYMEKLSKPIDYSNAYGVEWDVTIANPQLNRIGNPLLHKSLPIQSAFRGCVANKDKVVYYLDPNDWSRKENGEPSVLDGTDGTVRVHTPKFYGKSEVVGNKRRVWISLTLIDYTWDEIPEMLIDAYRSTTHATKGAVSVVNNTAEYRGGTRSTSYDLYSDLFRTTLGKPGTNMSRAAMRTHAKTAGSEMLSYELYKWIFVWCYVIEYANFNSQAAYNANLTSEGYHQGGLGPGITTIAYEIWGLYNGYNPITPCGYGNSIGNFTGVKTLVLPEFTYTKDGVEKTLAAQTMSMPRWRGFDNPFGDIWTNLDGIVIDTPLSGASDSSVVPTTYIITDPDKYIDGLEEAKINYTRKYTLPHSNGYIKELNLGIHGDIVPKTIGGNVTLYICDYYYVNYNNTPKTLVVGGSARTGGPAGLLSFSSLYGVSSAYAHVGFRTLNRIL